MGNHNEKYSQLIIFTIIRDSDDDYLIGLVVETNRLCRIDRLNGDSL